MGCCGSRDSGRFESWSDRLSRPVWLQIETQILVASGMISGVPGMGKEKNSMFGRSKVLLLSCVFLFLAVVKRS